MDNLKLGLLKYDREAFDRCMDRDAAYRIGLELWDKGYIVKSQREDWPSAFGYPQTVFEYKLHVPLAPPPRHR